MYKIILFIIMLEILELQSQEKLNRNKRFVIFPYGGSYKLVLGIGIPVMLPKPQSLTFATNVQFQHQQITNLTQIQQDLPVIINRRRRQAKTERALAYMALESLMDKPEYEREKKEFEIDNEYLEARKAGDFGVDCLSLYPKCTLGHSILDIISVLDVV